MGVAWNKTQFPGVRYREHATRKFRGRPDRYFTIRYRVDGNLREEGLGWASEDWNAQAASLVLAEMKRNAKTGEGPRALAEKRRLHSEAQRHAHEAREKAKREAVSFATHFSQAYLPQAKRDKTERSWAREEMLFRLWIEPEIGGLPFREITPGHLEAIKSRMLDAGLAPRSVQYALAVVRQVFNHARHTGLFEGTAPTSRVKVPRVDNRRLRFLTSEEADRLLSELNRRSQQLYELAFLSLHTGARADELFSLRWADVDLTRGTLTLWDTKSSKTRVAYLTAEAKALLGKSGKGVAGDLVFPGRKGEKHLQISKAFERAVEAVGLNSELTDERMRVVFHTLRHTYASWLVERGVDLYTVKELMGHSTLAMTERYSHVGENSLSRAVEALSRPRD